MNQISLINRDNMRSPSESKKAKVISEAGSQNQVSGKQPAFEELEVTHEVFFGENIKRVLSAFFGK